MKTYPLFIVAGLHGSGKSAAAAHLGRILPAFNVFDMDILYYPDQPDMLTVCENWLRIARVSAEYGKHTILFGCVPDPYPIESCEFYASFHPVHYLLLHCSDEVREQRLLVREGVTEDVIAPVLAAAREWLERARSATPPIPVVDTSRLPISEVALRIRDWALKRAKARPARG